MGKKTKDFRIIVRLVFTLFFVGTIGIAFPQQANTRITAAYYGKTMKQILIDFSKKTHYILDVDFEDLPGGIQKGRSFRDTETAAFLESILEGSDLKYKIVEDRLIIRPKNVEITYTAPVYKRKKDYTLNGQIVEITTGETMPFAQIIVDGTSNGAVTNVDGHFTLFHVLSDTCFLIVSYIGYKKQYFRLTPKLVSTDLRIELIPDVNELDLVEIVGDKEEKMLEVNSIKGMISMSPKQIVALPSIGDKDIFRSFQLLPGISGSNESSSGLYVRGGTPDQNLVLYDGFTVYHVDHLFGMFSAFNPDGIKNVQMSKGGFESKFGGRLSSVMEITGKDGNETQFNAGASVSLLSFSGFAEIPLAGKGALFISGRKSFESALYDKIFDQFNTNEAEAELVQSVGNRMMQSVSPTSYFYDLNAKATYKPTLKDEFSWSLYNGQDDLDNSRDQGFARAGFEMQGTNNDYTSWGNWGSNLKWSRKWNNNFYSNLLGLFSNYYSVRDKTSTMTRDDVEVTRGSYENNQLNDYSLKLDNEYKTGADNQIDFGLQASNITIDYDYHINDTLSIQDTYTAESTLAAYVQDDWMIWDKISLKPGIRTTYYTGTNKMYYEPRFSTRLHVTKKLSFSASWGIYYQFANRIVREDLESGSRDFWLLADDETIPVASSQHFIAGLTWENRTMLVETNAFYKPLSGLTEYTLRFVPSFHEVDYDEYFYTGTGLAKGVEFLLQKKVGDYAGWIGYTWSDVDYQFDIYGENSFPASHDVSHEFKIVNSYKWKNWIFSGTWIYATGKPYTPPLGAYQLENPDGTTSDYIVVGDKNRYRLPAYHRLDIAATLNFMLGEKMNGNLGFSLFNAYNRSNVWYKEFEVIDGELLETNVNLLGITPNVSFTIKLK